MTRAILAVLLLALAPAAEAASPVVMAHRGGSIVNGNARYPENTLAAFQAAVDLRVALELDTRFTEDGKVVVMHDNTLDRTTDCTGPVVEKTLAELADCEVDVLGSADTTKAAPVPQPIPTLAEVLTLARQTKSTVAVEINNYGDYDTAEYGAAVAAVIEASGIDQAKVILQSFLPQNVDAARAALPSAQTAAIGVKGFNDRARDFAVEKSYEWVFPNWPMDDGYVADVQGRGLAVSPYTLNDVADMKAAVALGVDALITDDPLAALRVIDTEKPTLTLRARTGSLPKVRRSLKLPLTVALDEAGTVAIKARIDGRLVGRATYEFAGAGKKRPVLRLSEAARRRMTDTDEATVKLKATARDLAQNASGERLSVQLR